MTIVTSYDFESDTWTHHTPPPAESDTMAEHQRWLDAVATVGERAKCSLPTHAARIDRALALVREGHVTPRADGLFQVRSQKSGTSKVYTVNGTCTCPDAHKTSDGWCKHVLAVAIYRRAKRMLREPAVHTTPAAQEPTAVESTITLDLDQAVISAETAQPVTDPTPAPQPVETRQSVPPQHLVTIQGKAFVRYVGLLQMAREQGLVSLTADWTYNDGDLSLAHAVATFADGRRFEESGDASPSNCTRMVQVHFRRVALTRAKARVLRDALGIDLVAVEELAESE